MHPPIPPGAYQRALRVTEDLVDIQGVVANHEIVRILVDTAAEHSTHLGWDLAAYHRLGAWWMVKRHVVDYGPSARRGDDLVCHTWPSAVSKASAERRHVLVRPSDGAIVARASNVWVLVDMKTGRPRRIPREVFAAFNPAQWSLPPDEAGA